MKLAFVRFTVRKLSLMLMMMYLGMCLLLASAILAAPPTDQPFQKIDPRVVEAAQQQESIQVLVYLSRQPGPEIARQQQENIMPDMEALDSQVRQLTQPFRLDDVMPEPIRLAVRELNLQREALAEGMRRSIISQVRAIVKPQQEGFIKFVEQDLTGRVFARITHVNMLGVEFPSAMLDRLANHPDVLRLVLNTVVIAEAELHDSIPTIGADTWHSYGYDGNGVDDVALLDTGIWDHVSLDLGPARSFIGDPGIVGDEDGHGTQVAGVVASEDSYCKGVAPGIDVLINARVFQRVDATLEKANVKRALEWAITGEVDGEPGPPNNQLAEIVNFSAGFDRVLYEGTDYSDLAQFFDIYVDNYQTVSITKSAGNQGNYGTKTITVPADAYNIIVVGAMVNDNDPPNEPNRSNDYIWYKSARGPTYSGRKKPDLVAPGVRITTTDRGAPGNKFVTVDGTSVAAPHVAGAIALLKDYGPWSNINVKAILINTADDWGSTGWDDRHGWGYINLDEAWEHRWWGWHTTFISPGEEYWLTGTMQNGDKTTVVWNCHGIDQYNNPLLSDIDLYVYVRNPNGTKGSLIGSSTDNTNNVKQVVSNVSTSVYVRVKGTSIKGVSSERISIAHPNGFTECSAPPSGAPAKADLLSETEVTDDVGQNFPNPFNPDTWIPYSISKPADVEIQIFDTSGRLVRTLELGTKSPGRYITRQRAAYWDGCNDVGEEVASGVYFYYLTAGDFKAARKMIIAK